MLRALRRAVYHTVLDVACSKVTLAVVERLTRWHATYRVRRAERQGPPGEG